MKFHEALHAIKSGKKIMFREGWPHSLKFNKDGYLILKDDKTGLGELTPYCVSLYDFNYEWEISE